MAPQETVFMGTLLATVSADRAIKVKLHEL
jgi:hypothetical protein